MPIGERFYYRHSEKVIDGTKCHEDGSNDICVEGRCMVSKFYLFFSIYSKLLQLNV